MSVLTMESAACPFCGRTFNHLSMDEALSLARFDQRLFWHYFLLRCPHEGELEFLEKSEATINALACANRYGKTTLLDGLHYHANVYKTGAEPRYMGEDGVVDLDAWMRTKYRTAHTAGELDQTNEVWNNAVQLYNESPRLAAHVDKPVFAKPNEMRFKNNARWLFRTLGSSSSGIDGKNFYVLSIDEAGWIGNLEEMMNNVLRVRVADVRGRIVIVGTFKPGMSRDFFKICVRASAYTGAGIGFDHRSSGDDEEDGTIDAALRRYARDAGFDLDAALAEAREAGVVA